MTSTPPIKTRRPVRDAASEEPTQAEAAMPTVDMAHCCPHCGRPVAVLNLLVPVEEPPAEND